MPRRGGTPSHSYEVVGTLEGCLWACSCGTSSGHVYSSEDAAVASAERHVTESPPRLR